MKITNYDITSTVDSPSYWQGEGLSHSKYEYIATGNGSSEREALDDALEQIAMEHTAAVIPDELEADREKASTDTLPPHCTSCGDDLEDPDVDICPSCGEPPDTESDDNQWYVTVKYNLG